MLFKTALNRWRRIITFCHAYLVTLHIAVSLNDKEIVFSVKDFGSGIEKGEHTEIFDRFYQVLNINRSNAGFGLGLYISAQIIKRQNGKIWVESEPGKGSTFYFSLPLNN